MPWLKVGQEGKGHNSLLKNRPAYLLTTTTLKALYNMELQPDKLIINLDEYSAVVNEFSTAVELFKAAYERVKAANDKISSFTFLFQGESHTQQGESLQTLHNSDFQSKSSASLEGKCQPAFGSQILDDLRRNESQTAL